MRIRKPLIVVVGVALISVGFLAGRTVEKKGTPDSPGGPHDAASESYTLEDIYSRLDTGALGTPGAFTEPTSGPGTGTMHTLNEIMALIPDPGSNVEGGDGDISFGIPDGIYRSKTATAKDSDLKAEDIRDGVQIFNVTGTNQTCVQCTGTPFGDEPEPRWCDNGDGTVTDMTTGLVWLKRADWGGQKTWDCPGGYGCDAHTRAGILKDGFYHANLSDDSVVGDWRLPTKTELLGLANGTEAVRSGYMQAFTGVQSDGYWSSTSDCYVYDHAWYVSMGTGGIGNCHRTHDLYVWPVRGP